MSCTVNIFDRILEIRNLFFSHCEEDEKEKPLESVQYGEQVVKHDPGVIHGQEAEHPRQTCKRMETSC